MAENEFDLDDLDLNELKRLQKDVTKAIDNFQERKKREEEASGPRRGFGSESRSGAGAVWQHVVFQAGLPH